MLDDLEQVMRTASVKKWSSRYQISLLSQLLCNKSLASELTKSDSVCVHNFPVSNFT